MYVYIHMHVDVCMCWSERERERDEPGGRAIYTTMRCCCFNALACLGRISGRAKRAKRSETEGSCVCLKRLLLEVFCTFPQALARTNCSSVVDLCE
jgi:hypothetical protein